MSYERLNITDFVDKWDVAKVQHLEDAIIANEQAINNAGGGVQADWKQNDETATDHIKNRPFYEENITVSLFEETVLDGFEYYYSEDYECEYYARRTTVPLSNSVKLSVGDTCIVAWDGVIYECAYNEEYEGWGYLGHYPYDDDGPYSFSTFPFAIIIKDGCIPYIYTNDSSSSHTIKISTKTTILKKLDQKFIPDHIANPVNADWREYNEDSPAYIQNRTHGVVGKTTAERIARFEVTEYTQAITIEGIHKKLQDGQLYSMYIWEDKGDCDWESEDGYLTCNEHYYDNADDEYFANSLIGNPFTDNVADIESHAFVYTSGNYNEFEGEYEPDTLNVTLDPDYWTLPVYITLYDVVDAIEQLDEIYIPDTIARVSNIPSKLSELDNDIAVKYTAQALNPIQQIQARKNLGLYYYDSNITYYFMNMAVSGSVTIDGEAPPSGIDYTMIVDDVEYLATLTVTESANTGIFYFEHEDSPVHITWRSSRSTYELTSLDGLEHVVSLYAVMNVLEQVEDKFIPDTIARAPKAVLSHVDTTPTAEQYNALLDILKEAGIITIE